MLKKNRILIIMLSIVFLLSSLSSLTLTKVVAQETPKGPWVDEVDFFVEEDEAKVVDMLLKNEMQVYFRDITDPELFSRIKASPSLWYVTSYGLYFEITFNPSGPEFKNGKLNPFSVPKIREAMNCLVDRRYICDEIMAGMAVPKYTTLTPAFPDYARYIDTVLKIEEEYSYNLEKARTVITEEMTKLGAEMREGKWYYKGEPVTLIFIIRIEDQRRGIGDYVASQLEKLGFTVDRQYKRSKEASPICMGSDPAEGLWHLYTAGWITTLVSRDESDNFGFFYTSRGPPGPLWQAYTPDPEFDEVAGKLWNREFSTMEERNELMVKALKLSMKDSVRVWLVSQVAPWPARKDVSLTYDLAAGFSGARLWPYTIRYTDRAGGSIKIASSDIFVEPVNPVGGSNWIYDSMYYRATSDPTVMPDPFTGLYWPQRVKKAEVSVLKGLPVSVTLDWVSLNFVDNIIVPADAWYDWDAEKQEIIYAPAGTTAKTKTVVYYDDNLFNMKAHDGSKLSLADIVFAYILTFDRANPKSPVYDESAVPAFEAFREYFKGFRIVSENPLVIEYYSDAMYLDAEWIAATATGAFFVDYAYGPGLWHTLAIGWLAEANGELAFSSDKADSLKVEWTSYIAGPSIPILKKYLDQAIADKFIPYENVLGKYVNENEALERYNNLKNWYDAKGHFLVGIGPFYIDRVDTTARVLVLKAFREFPDDADKWLTLYKSAIPEVKLYSISSITPGSPAEIPVSIMLAEEPYKVRDILYVKYVIKSPVSTIVGEAEPIRDGEWSIRLTSEDTSKLISTEIPISTVGITVIALAIPVGMPISAEGTTLAIDVRGYVASELAKAKADYETKISGLQSSINELKASINSLNSTVNTIMIIAIIAIVIAVAALALPFIIKRK
ncbi:MAG: ABC transporter substrate-binding protein [Thermoproteota archaeon]